MDVEISASYPGTIFLPNRQTFGVLSLYRSIWHKGKDVGKCGILTLWKLITVTTWISASLFYCRCPCSEGDLMTLNVNYGYPWLFNTRFIFRRGFSDTKRKTGNIVLAGVPQGFVLRPLLVFFYQIGWCIFNYNDRTNNQIINLFLKTSEREWNFLDILRINSKAFNITTSIICIQALSQILYLPDNLGQTILNPNIKTVSVFTNKKSMFPNVSDSEKNKKEMYIVSWVAYHWIRHSQYLLFMQNSWNLILSQMNLSGNYYVSI